MAWSIRTTARPTPAVDDGDDGSMNRRRFLVGGGIVAAGALGAVVLSSVRSDSGGGSAATTDGSGSAGAGLGDGADEVNVINWTEYIDLTEEGEVGSVDRFQDETGISVNYSETWNDNNEAYGKEFVAYMEAGNPTPWDIAVPTYWLAARLKSDGYLAPIPYNLIPNYVNLEPQYLNVAWDPGGKFNLPWQGGVTGFAYNIAETGRELTSVNELFNPEFAGRVGFFTEMRDSLGLVMLGMGNDPANPTEDAINDALDKIEAATNDGQIRRFTGNDYLQDIQNGNFAVLHRLVRRHRAGVQPGRPLRVPRGGGDVVVRHDGHPARTRRTASRRRSSWTSSTTPSTPPRSPPTCSSSPRSVGCRTSWSSWAVTPPRWPRARCCSRATRRRRTCTSTATCRRSSTRP